MACGCFNKTLDIALLASTFEYGILDVGQLKKHSNGNQDYKYLQRFVLKMIKNGQWFHFCEVINIEISSKSISNHYSSQLLLFHSI